MKKKIPPTQITQPETFILESLSPDDEENQRLDGKVLYEVLRLQGKKPIYYYFRTQTELVRFADIFRESGYRYLHLSCHGDEQRLEFTFGQTDYQNFANIFEKKLNNRRLFISGCSLGNSEFANALFSKWWHVFGYRTNKEGFFLSNYFFLASFLLHDACVGFECHEAGASTSCS
jgi:hypothetical protein